MLPRRIREGGDVITIVILIVVRSSRNKIITMIRILAAAVMVLQLQALGAPALMAHPGHTDRHACEEAVAVHAYASHADHELDCQDCDTPGCEAMPGCSALTAFAAPAAETGLMQLFAQAGEPDRSSHPDEDRGPPILPPPRA